MSTHHKLPRLYVTAPLGPDKATPLTAEQAHYLKNVLRQVEGNHIRAFNGRDGEWLMELTNLSKKSADTICLEQLREQPVTGEEIHLFFAPIKKSRLDFLIEKATELGVTHLHPVLSEHTEVRKLNEGRINAQIIEASEQCERLDIPHVEAPVSLPDALQKFKSGMQILAGIERIEKIPHISELKISCPIGVLVGPEGGFSASEIDLLLAMPHIKPVSLGQNILRAETAALKFLACIPSLK